MHPTSKKLADLEKEQKNKITKMENKLQKKKLALIDIRKEELFAIFDSHSSLAISDELLIGFLTFLNDERNKDDPIIQEFIKLGTKNKSPKSKGPKKPIGKTIEQTNN